MTGFLRKNERGRWEIFEPFGRVRELTSGDCLELAGKGKWIAVRLEHDGRKYYTFPAHALEDEMVARTID